MTEENSPTTADLKPLRPPPPTDIYVVHVFGRDYIIFRGTKRHPEEVPDYKVEVIVP